MYIYIYIVWYRDLFKILYHTILYYTIPYYTILYYTILYYTIPGRRSKPCRTRGWGEKALRGVPAGHGIG